MLIGQRCPSKYSSPSKGTIILTNNFFRNSLFSGTTEGYLRSVTDLVKTSAKSKYKYKDYELTNEVLLDYVVNDYTGSKFAKRHQKIIDYYESELKPSGREMEFVKST